MLTVFEFTEPREYLAHVFKEKQAQNPRFSLRAWTRQLGLKSPAGLSMILHGQRKLPVELTTRLSDALKLKQEERFYLQLLALFANAKSENEKEFYSHLMAKLRPKSELHSLPLDQFRLIADWYHYAIYEMVDLQDFRGDPKWIADRLGKAITAIMAQEAVERLIRLKLLKRDGESGRLMKNTVDPVRTPDDVPSAALRKFHSQMITKALNALETQTVTEREVSSETLCLKEADLPLAKELIRRFQLELSRLCSSTAGDHVYQFNVQMFRLTEKGEGK